MMVFASFLTLRENPLEIYGETHIHVIGVPNPSDLELKVDN
jgi:hypothetical protein